MCGYAVLAPMCVGVVHAREAREKYRFPQGLPGATPSLASRPLMDLPSAVLAPGQVQQSPEGKDIFSLACIFVGFQAAYY